MAIYYWFKRKEWKIGQEGKKRKEKMQWGRAGRKKKSLYWVTKNEEFPGSFSTFVHTNQILHDKAAPKNRIGKLPSAACNSRLGSESATKDARYSLCLQCHRVYLLCYPYFSLWNMASHCKCMPLRFVFSIFCFDKIKCLIVLTWCKFVAG